MIRIAIAEDDPQCFAQLEQYIGDYGRETGRAFQVTHYDNGEDLVERYNGILRTERRDGVFAASVLLPLELVEPAQDMKPAV